MNRQHPDPELSGGFDRFRNRVRNVVQFEIEKNRPEKEGRSDESRASRCVTLQPDLECAYFAGQQNHQSERLFLRRDVERDDDLLRGWRFHSVVLRFLVNKLQDMQLSAPAKINLSFQVKGRRPDGFHEIETLMAPVSLADRI